MQITNFTYSAYGDMLVLIKENGYNFCSYHDHSSTQRPCILRHDIDMDIQKAKEMASFEVKQSGKIRSTFFVLLRTDFYNPASSKNVRLLTDIMEMGHEIGLHFDEMAYVNLSSESDLRDAVKTEVSILSDIIRSEIKVISMHRPSKKTLESDYQFSGVVNSYSSLFFRQFKYLSDSRHSWRLDPVSEITSPENRKLHIVTHPIWYTEKLSCPHDNLVNFIKQGQTERFISLRENIRDINEFVKEEEL